MKVRFSIRYKILSIITVLLVACVGSYLFLASMLFKEDKTEFIFDSNLATVKNLSSEVDTLFSGLVDKLRLSAFLASKPSNYNKHMLSSIMVDQSDIVYLAVSKDFENLQELYSDKKFFDLYLDDESRVELHDISSTPFEELRKRGESVWGIHRDGLRLIGFGKNVIVENDKGKALNQFLVVAFVKPDRIIKSLSGNTINQPVILDSLGRVVVVADMTSLTDIADYGPLVEKSKTQQMPSGVMSYRVAEKPMLGAYSKAFQGRLIVASKVSEPVAFAVVYRLFYRSAVFASIIVTLAFIVAILFSKNLTQPLDRLLGRVKKLGEGDYDSQVESTTKDEIAVLTNTFNDMVRDLKQSKDSLEETNRNLESKVKERTKQLEVQNIAVKEAQEALLRSTKLAAAGEVAGQAAHEVLNPISVILSRLHKLDSELEKRRHDTKLFSEIQKAWMDDYNSGGFSKLEQVWREPSKVDSSTSLWDEDMNNLSTIFSQVQATFDGIQQDTVFLSSECKRITRIVDSMRSMSIVKGSVDIYSIHKLLENSINVMADLADQRGVNISFTPEALNDLSEVNEDEFLQVMTNLIRNSIQAIEAKDDQNFSGQLKISTENRDGQIKILLKDNGVGVPDNVKKHLFEKYFSTKNKEEGTGIGLSLSRRLIRAFKGNIELVYSEEGSGTFFEVSLPNASETNFGGEGSTNTQGEVA